MAMRWYLLHAYSKFEKQAAQAIRERAKSCGLTHLFDQQAGDGGVMVPIERVIEVRRGVRVDAERYFLPGYVLVRCEMTDELTRFLRTIPHVTGFLGNNNEPMAIADATIDQMLATEYRQPRPYSGRPRPSRRWSSLRDDQPHDEDGSGNVRAIAFNTS